MEADSHHPGRQGSLIAVSFALSALVFTVALLIGCAGARRHRPSSDEQKPGPQIDQKRDVEAYLFDTEIEYRGKYSSVRLELYATDTIVGVGGRSYLGKGALDGWITPDTVKLLFPTTNEYVFEPVTRLLRSFDCTREDAPILDLLAFFFGPPSRENVGDNVLIDIDTTDSDRPVYDLHMEGCPWQITLIYDQRDSGWRIREFAFMNGDNLTIDAKRREYKAEASAGREKFQVDIPRDAVRITP